MARKVLILILLLGQGDNFIAGHVSTTKVQGFYNNSTRQERMYSFFNNGGSGGEADQACGNGADSGICTSSTKCKSKGGATVNAGTSACSSGGVCCQIKARCSTNLLEPCVIKTSGTTIVNENPNNGNRYTRIYQYRKPKGVCQLRLDFDLFVFQGPDISGDCNTDTIIVGGMSICGTNSGQHAYFEFGDAQTIDALLRIQSTTARYSVRSTFIRCNSEREAPPNCLQYYSGMEDTVRSFSYPMQTNQIEYSVCVKVAPGMNRIKWKECTNLPATETAFWVSDYDLQGPLRGEACLDKDFVQINGLYRYCGHGFSSVTTAAKPFILHVSFDEIEGPSVILPTSVTECPATLPDPVLGGTWTCTVVTGICTCSFAPMRTPAKYPEFDNTGFCLQYMQLP